MTNSSSLQPGRQPHAIGIFRVAFLGSDRNRLALLLAGALVLWGGAGCRTVYDDAWSLHPTDPEVRLELRMEEARKAFRRGERAARVLDSDESKGTTGEALQPPRDRLRMAAYDVQRRVKAAQAAAAGCEDAAAAEVELTRYAVQAVAWLSRVNP